MLETIKLLLKRGSIPRGIISQLMKKYRRESTCRE